EPAALKEPRGEMRNLIDRALVFDPGPLGLGELPADQVGVSSAVHRRGPLFLGLAACAFLVRKVWSSQSSSNLSAWGSPLGSARTVRRAWRHRRPILLRNPPDARLPWDRWAVLGRARVLAWSASI